MVEIVNRETKDDDEKKREKEEYLQQLSVPTTYQQFKSNINVKNESGQVKSL
jgi:hypothetical protein